MATTATSNSIPKPTCICHADMVTTSPESRQIKMGKWNKANNGISSETSTSTTNNNENDNHDEDKDDSDEDDHDNTEPKDHHKLSSNSVDIAKGRGSSTYNNAATPITPATNKGNSASGKDNNNNSGPWGGNNTSGTAGGIATALTPTCTTASTPTTSGNLDMVLHHDLQGASCMVGGILCGWAHGNVTLPDKVYAVWK